MKKAVIAASAAFAALAVAAPASATVTITLTNACSAAPVDISNVAAGSQTCSGYYAGQLLSNGGNDPDNQKAALNSLGMNTASFNFGSYTKISGINGVPGQVVSGFGQLTGTTYIGIHYGNGNGAPTQGQGDATAFYRLDLGNTVLTSLTLAFGASSDVVIYSTGTTAVPEPATWAMMIGGFGVIGVAARRRRRTTQVSFS